MSKFYYPNNAILFPKWSYVAPAVPWWKRLWWLFLLLPLLVLAALWFLYWGPDRNVMRSTVIVNVDVDGDGKFDAQGSGVFISPKGYVLTNRHVVFAGAGTTKPAKIQVWYLPGTRDLQKMDATLERNGEGAIDTTPEAIRNDWAVLRVTTQEKLPWVPLMEKTDFKEEEGLKAFGFPRAPETATNEFGPSVKVVQGIINRVDRSAQQGVVRLTHSASTAEGMSGGPVTQRGRLIGLNTAVLAPTAPGSGSGVTPNENYALPVYLLKESVFKNYATP